MTTAPEHCPKCRADFQGAEIPENSRHLYGGETHFSRVLGVSIPSAYDGVLYWECPDCGYAMPRDFGEGYRRRNELAREYATRANEREYPPQAVCPVCAHMTRLDDDGNFIRHAYERVKGSAALAGRGVPDCPGTGRHFHAVTQ